MRSHVPSASLPVAALIAVALAPPASHAELEEVTVTAQRREQSQSDVPFSLVTLSGDDAADYLEAGEDIRALSARIPSLNAESSNGRVAPRFYIRGLGNTDFDLAASQPVQVLVDEIPMENVILKSFPLFDIERVEVLRGPQGTLFGRNTPAGTIKFDTVKPSQDFDAYVNTTVGTLGTVNARGAIGGGLTDNLSARISILTQNRDDWVDNDFTGETNALGGFGEVAYRAQLLYQTDSFSALVSAHGRNLDGTSSIFRANIFTTGSNELNENFDRDVVFFDEGDNNEQEYDSYGGLIRLEGAFANDMTLTALGSWETTEGFSIGDIDGGFGASFAPPFGPGFIPFNSVTRDSIDTLDQFTGEVRLASADDGPFTWQVGALYFTQAFDITTAPFFVGPTTVSHENDSWALFGQGSYALLDNLVATAGVRYTDDSRDFNVLQLFGESATGLGPEFSPSVEDEEVTWDLALNLGLTDEVTLFTRYARGFRAPTIQGRDVAFFGLPSVADSETVDSFEIGAKSEFGAFRSNVAVFYYQVDDQQLSAIGGEGNLVQLVNADRATGFGIEGDLEAVFDLGDASSLLMRVGGSYVDTEIKDDTLLVAPCGSGACTPTDPLVDGNALVDGNPLPQAPGFTLSLLARYTLDLGAAQFFLYQSEEFFTDDAYEGAVRTGVNWNDGRYEIAAFGRNITDNEFARGAVDFNNLTGFVNDPRVWGVTFSARY